MFDERDYVLFDWGVIAMNVSNDNAYYRIQFQKVYLLNAHSKLHQHISNWLPSLNVGRQWNKLFVMTLRLVQLDLEIIKASPQSLISFQDNEILYFHGEFSHQINSVIYLIVSKSMFWILTTSMVQTTNFITMTQRSIRLQQV